MNTISKGKSSEDLAINYLLGRFHKFVSRNIYTRFGEIDLLMLDQDSNEHVFVEVKSGDLALSNLTPRKLSRIERTINTLVPKMRIKSWRFDVLLVNRDQVEWFKQIT